MQLTVTRAAAPGRQNLIALMALQAAREFAKGHAVQLSAHHMREILAKAAQNPASVANIEWAGALVQTETVAFYQSVRQSVLGQLIGRAQVVDVKSELAIPGPAAPSQAATFVPEGAATPVISGTLNDSAQIQPGKLAVIAGCSRELLDAGNGTDVLLTSVLSEAIALGTDAALLSSTAATASQPAGLGNGAQTVAGSADIVVDVKGALEKLPAGAVDPVWLAHPSAFVSAQAANIGTVNAGQAYIGGLPAALSPAVDPTALWLVDAQSIVINVGGTVPTFEKSDAATIVFDDAPSAFVDAAGVVSANVRSTFQEYTLLMRAVLPAWWVARDASRVMVISGGTWNAPTTP